MFIFTASIFFLTMSIISFLMAIKNKDGEMGVFYKIVSELSLVYFVGILIIMFIIK